MEAHNLVNFVQVDGLAVPRWVVVARASGGGESPPPAKERGCLPPGQGGRPAHTTNPKAEGEGWWLGQIVTAILGLPDSGRLRFNLGFARKPF